MAIPIFRNRKSSERPGRTGQSIVASLDKRPNGTWRARWREYPAGPQRTRTFPRKLDAEQFLVKTMHDLMTGAYIDPTKGRTTVQEFYEVWSGRQPWRASSRASVASVFRAHVLPAFGSRPLGSIRRGDVESWAASLPIAPSTVHLAMQYLGTLFAAAVADGLVAASPTRGAKRPRVEAQPIVPFTPAELDRLWDATPDSLCVALTLGAMAGLRHGEAIGLTIDRLDLPRRLLVVDRQLLRVEAGRPVFGPPKTARSYRTVPLPDVARDYLAAHLERHGPGTGGVVVHQKGRPIRRQDFGKIWREVRTAAKMPTARYHDCRHTYASTLLSGGVSVAAAAEYLGHSPGELLKTYAHLMPADHDRARAVVQAAFARPAEDSLRTGAAS